MKIGQYAFILTLAVAGCDKLNTQTSTPSPTPPLVAEVTPSPGPHFAPEGVFYLVAMYRVETKNGVIGLPPGTGVKRVREGVYLTPSGELAIPANFLTNDMDLARQARDADRATQVAARPVAPTIHTPVPKSALVMSSLGKGTPIPAPSSDLSVAAQRAELNKKRALIQQQIASVMAELHENPVHSTRKSPNAERLHGELNDLHDQLRQINEQMIQLR
jgi:hypothetical protein